MLLFARYLACVLVISFPSISWGQAMGGGSLLQGGAWTQGHTPMYVGQGSSQAIVQDSGPASGGGNGVGLSEELLIARGMGTPPFVGQGSGPSGTNWCDYDAPTNNPTGYHFICISPNVNGSALITTGAGGSASAQPLTFSINGINTTYSGSMPTLISVGASFTGGLISVSGSPITTSGTLGFSVAGTSGGIPYFNSANTWTSTPVLTLNRPILGGGSGNPPFPGSKSGSTNTLATTSGSFVNGDCLSADGLGNVVDAGGPCTTGGGGGTVASSTTNNMTYYAANGTTVSGLATANNGVLVTSSGGVPSISSTLPSAVQGNITTLGTITSGTWNAALIPVVYGGTGLASGTSGGILGFTGSTTISSSSALTAGLPIIGGGPGVLPSSALKSGNTTNFVTTTGTLTSGDCSSWDSSGNSIDAGFICSPNTVYSGTDGGTANAKVITAPNFSLSSNNTVVFKATSTNTSTATANVNGTGVENIEVATPSGPVALSPGQIVANNEVLLTYDGTEYQLINPVSSLSPTGFCQNQGLVIKNDSTTPNTKIDINSSFSQIVTSLNVGIDRSGISLVLNALTNGANGLDTGSLAASTWYYVWLIDNGSTTASLLSLSSTSPTLPSGYIYSCRVGAVLTSSSTQFFRTLQKGNRVQYVTTSGSNTPSYPQILSSIFTYIPPTSTTLRAIAQVFGSGGVVSTETIGANAVGPIITATAYVAVGDGGESVSSYGEILLESSSISVNGSGSAFVVGWVDNVSAF